MERGGAGRGSRLGAHRRDAGEPQAVGDLRRDVGAVLELLAVHDADLESVEAADRGVRERLAVGVGEEIEDGREDAPGEVDLGEANRCEVDLLGHRARQ